MATDKKSSGRLQMFIAVILITIALQFLVSYIWPKKTEEVPPVQGSGVMLSTPKREVAVGNRIDVTIANEGTTRVTIPAHCPNPPFTIERDGAPVEPLSATGCTALPAALEPKGQPGDRATLSLGPWYGMFRAPGTYRLSTTLTGADGAAVTPSTEVVVEERGFFSNLGLVSLYQPLYNLLVWLAVTLPGHNLGWAIIVLTFIIRVILFFPTYRSLAHQADLQALQPEMERLKKQYADDKEKQAAEVMKLYKEKGVNPFGSCLPILIQLPILYALFFVLRDGLDPSNQWLLYPFLEHHDLSTITSRFAGLDLTHLHVWQLAVIVAALQFLSMKIIQWTAKPADGAAPSPAATANVMMTYFLPLLVGYFSYTVAAGLGLYWATSTLFGIGQQMIIKRERDRQKERVGIGKAAVDAEFTEVENPPRTPPPAPNPRTGRATKR